MMPNTATPPARAATPPAQYCNPPGRPTPHVMDLHATRVTSQVRILRNTPPTPFGARPLANLTRISTHIIPPISTLYAPHTMPALRKLSAHPPTLSLLSRASTTTSLTHLYPTPLTRSMSSSHGSHYDPPTGWFLGVPPGEKQTKEGWEGIWYWGFFGGLFAAGVAYAYKPDTS